MQRIIAWFVDNPVSANLLMGVLVFGGLLTLPTIRQEEFPNIDTEVVQISVPYLGAAPEEAEEAVCVRIEEAIEGTSGIDRITSIAAEGACVVMVELVEGTDTNWALSEIENKVDGITTFPRETEKPMVSYLVIRGEVLEIAIRGDADERTLKVIGQRTRDEIAALPGVSQVELLYARPYEISIEVSEQALRRHGLSFDQVASAVRNSSLDLPGGSLKTAGGEILLRSKAQAYRGEEFESIVVLTRPDGTTVALGEIARVVDGFKEQDLRAYFDGKPAVLVKVFRVGEEDAIELAETVKAYIVRARLDLPEGIEMVVWKDEAQNLRDRIDVLMRNALGGLFFVLVVLAMILRFRLALWVAAGIPISLLGAVLCFPSLDLSISTLAVMGFILVLGIVVDDAIVVGERIYAYEQQGFSGREAAVRGTHEVSVPVIFGVLTTIVAFAPLILVPGRMGRVFSALGLTVVLCLVMSLVEAKLILPAHLAHRRREEEGKRRARRWSRVQDRVGGGLESFVARYYRPALERVIEWRYLAVASAVAVLILTFALYASGRITFQFFPGVEGDRVFATLTLPAGTPLAVTEAAVRQLESSAEVVRDEIDRERGSGPSVVRHVFSSIGAQVGRDGPGRPESSGGGTHLAEVVMELLPFRERDTPTRQVASRWRERTGPIPDAVELAFESTSFHAGEAIAIQLVGSDVGTLTSAAAELRGVLGTYDGVFDIADSFRSGKQEVKLALLPEAKPLGITQNDLARQVRTAFYGVEVQRIQRGSDDVRVMVRYPEEERRSLGDLENMRIRAPDGTEIPFAAVARAELGRGFASIRRSDGRRVVTVTADVDRTVTTPEEVMSSLRRGALPEILAAHPGVEWSLEGEQRERAKALAGLARAFALAMLVIYCLLAVPLRSYTQPLIIMAAIPFGTVGAFLGHLVMGWDLVFFSLLGIVALSGVVVNDSLVLVAFINRRRDEGMPLEQAVREAGMARFRAIFLTSATTFAGLTPLMFLASPATFFVIPIAISLAFGVLFGTVITLFVVPCGYLILDDLLRLLGGARSSAEPEAASAA